MQKRVYIVQTPVRDTSAVTSDLKQRLIDSVLMLLTENYQN